MKNPLAAIRSFRATSIALAAACAYLALPVLAEVQPAPKSENSAKSAVTASRDQRPWMNKSLSPRRRADVLVQAMTLDEKLTMMHGAAPCEDVWTDKCANPLKEYVGYTPPNTRLGIPELTMSDGRAAVENGAKDVTLFPVALEVASSWDVGLMNAFGRALGQEQRIKGTTVMLGPTMDVVRVPEWGRIFETYGEDPYFNARMAVAEIKGIQSEGVLANANMYLTMNQDKNRNNGQDTIVDERVLQEIYLPPFAAAVQDAHVGSFMCAYVRNNGVFSCENEYLLNTILRKQLNFDGWVLSDWGATHSVVDAANHGFDQQMPDSTFFGAPLKQAVDEGKVSVATIDEHVRHILVPMFRQGFFDHPRTGKWTASARSAEHDTLARRIAEEGTVLLRNEHNTLPLSPKASIAVIGKAGCTSPKVETETIEGIAPYVISPLDGIRKRAPIASSYDGSDPAAAADAARNADVAIVFVQTDESEGDDRSDLVLPNNQNALIAAAAAANKKTIVVLNTGGAVLMPWLDQVAAVIQAWYPGQEDGNALAAILYGEVNPSAKLPLTFPRVAGETPLQQKEQWPGVDGKSYYSEKLNVGYRWYDATNTQPLFPFGFGLSYTTFKVSNLAVTPDKLTTSTEPLKATVTVDVTNAGKRFGAEVVQIYIGHPAANGEPPHRLAAFGKVELKPDETKQVTLALDGTPFRIFDVEQHAWEIPPGTYEILAGTSSRDLPLKRTITIR
jgi:beta-glucosidase